MAAAATVEYLFCLILCLSFQCPSFYANSAQPYTAADTSFSLNHCIFPEPLDNPSPLHDMHSKHTKARVRQSTMLQYTPRKHKLWRTSAPHRTCFVSSTGNVCIGR
jgi:hypothetical protein